MTTYDTILGPGSKIELGDILITKYISLNVKSISTIYVYLSNYEDKEWLNRATNQAMGEMISDVDEVVKEAKEVIKSARKQIPFHHRYFLIPIKLWLQKLK